MSKINIEAIKAGDRVRVSLHGLPERHVRGENQNEV